MNDRTDALPIAFQEAITEYGSWAANQANAEQARNTINAPLYHYTNGAGLRGIFENGCIWFTDYRHLNDPSELNHGIDLVHDVARGMANGSDERTRLFLSNFTNMFQEKKLSENLQFFVASLSRQRDDLGQWRAYADNGRGFAIGFAPRMFRVTDNPREGNLPEFVSEVIYSLPDALGRFGAALEEALRIFLATTEAHTNHASDPAIGVPFMESLSRECMAMPLIWNCLTTKHPAYAHEEEVRLIIMGTLERLMPHVRTRFRGSEIVPFISQPMPTRENFQIAEIVVGPAAPDGTERDLTTMLRSIGIDVNFPIGRSDIPYRA